MNTIPKGFRIGTAAAGFRRPDRDDLALILSDVPATAAGVFTTNVFKAAPVLVAQSVLHGDTPVRGIVVNSGQANACTGDEGIENCCVSLAMVGQAVDCPATSLIPLSTGIIGAPLKMDLWAQAVPQLVDSLGTKSGEDFTRAMMTTDAFPKFMPLSLNLAGGSVRLLGMAKGAGMICPNMATMLSVVLCDARIDADLWREMFPHAVANTFNRVSVDGDTSTNDTVIGLANGASGVVDSPQEYPVL
ncbi:MAG: bifunctional ornithine acetyltransferase/N-acetylglutamate synthase, partial [Desulfovibrionaceae bacterium]